MSVSDLSAKLTSSSFPKILPGGGTDGQSDSLTLVVRQSGVLANWRSGSSRLACAIIRILMSMLHARGFAATAWRTG